MAQEYTTLVLKKQHVDLLLNCCIQKVSVSDGKYQIHPKAETAAVVPHIVEFDTLFMCTGGVPNTQFMRQHFAERLTPQGILKVNTFAQLEGHCNIFVVGDVGDFAEEKMAARALAHAKVAVKNIWALAMGVPVHASYVPAKDPLIVISLGPQCAIAFEGGISVAGGATAAAMKRNMDTTAHKLFPNVPHFQLPFIPLANVAPVPSGGSSMPNGSVIALLNAFDTRVGAKLAKLLAKLHLVARHAVTGLDHNAKALFLRDAFHVQVLQYRPGELADVTRVLQGAYCALYVHRQSAAGAELMHEASLFLCAAKQCGVPVVFFCREARV
eukprot:TRINITY_DN2250_c0_g1_i1.p1 TRINITY_DN2250_c0_g1~~TRINITY_DN2250_c0_g1_i1.p1  ORF type:complete len:379 (-),score=55.02 TRINITY_DN2250_c0_g1_i1:99-1079(-)